MPTKGRVDAYDVFDPRQHRWQQHIADVLPEHDHREAKRRVYLDAIEVAAAAWGPTLPAPLEADAGSLVVYIATEFQRFAGTSGTKNTRIDAIEAELSSMRSRLEQLERAIAEAKSLDDRFDEELGQLAQTLGREGDTSIAEDYDLSAAFELLDE